MVRSGRFVFGGTPHCASVSTGGKRGGPSKTVVARGRSKPRMRGGCVGDDCPPSDHESEQLTMQSEGGDDEIMVRVRRERYEEHKSGRNDIKAALEKYGTNVLDAYSFRGLGARAFSEAENRFYDDEEGVFIAGENTVISAHDAWKIVEYGLGADGALKARLFRIAELDERGVGRMQPMHVGRPIVTYDAFVDALKSDDNEILYASPLAKPDKQYPPPRGLSGGAPRRGTSRVGRKTTRAPRVSRGRVADSGKASSGRKRSVPNCADKTGAKKKGVGTAGASGRGAKSTPRSGRAGPRSKSRGRGGRG